ncbi:hypothetical protein, partial [Staphylococcus aureus]
FVFFFFLFFQAEDGIRDRSVSRGLGDVYKRQTLYKPRKMNIVINHYLFHISSTPSLNVTKYSQ